MSCQKVLIKINVTSLCLVVALSCSGRREKPNENGHRALLLTSSSISEGASIPAKYTCQGEDVSPQFSFATIPENAKTLALVCEDPDAPGGTWVHWVLYNLPTRVTQLGEGVPTKDRLENGGMQGKNDFGRIGYGGPCPPVGSAHHYSFTLYALDSELTLNPGVTKAEVDAAMRDHVLAKSTLVATYSRK